MTIRKKLSIATVVLFMAFAMPVYSAIVIPQASQNNSPARQVDPRGQQLLQRLSDIRDMNKSALNRMEKKSLRKEVKGIKSEMRIIKGGIYLSVGALLITVLLLILLL